MECPAARVGVVIGTKGSVITEMMKKTGCKIVINQEFPDGHPREAIFTGNKEQIEAAKSLVNAVVVHGPLILSSVDIINQATAAALAIAQQSAVSVAAATFALSRQSTSSTAGSNKLAGSLATQPQLVRAVTAPSTTTNTSFNTAAVGEYTKKEREGDRRETGSKANMGVGFLSNRHFEDIDSLCVICAEPFADGRRILAYGACNHKGPCSVCSVRMRTVGSDYSCALCRQEMAYVVCSSRDKPFIDFHLPHNPPADLHYHSRSRMFIPQDHYEMHIKPLFEYSCRDCYEVFEDGDILRTHYENYHQLTQCVLCTHFKQVNCVSIFILLKSFVSFLSVQKLTS